MTHGTSSSAWFAVRCVFVDRENRPWGPTDLEPGEAAYEERITLWTADSAEAAIALAEADAEEYAATLGCDYTGLAQCYLCDEPPAQGVEIFSLIRRSPLAPGAYIDRHFDTGGEFEQRVETD